MLPTFVIALREGVEASLIVGILAAFLVKQGRKDALRWMWTGVALASSACLAFGIGLHLLDQTLPQKQQEGLETAVALVAVAVVTYMVVWMKRHARELKGQLERHAGEAIARGSVKALIAMAFFAVLREGFETAVFLVAQFQSSSNAGTALGGSVLGLAIAVGIGWGAYKGGARINLAKFFRATGVLLVVVAAGLVASAAHTAHEAGILDALQQRVLDLSWLAEAGTVRGALVTGMLGIQPTPVVAEVIGWTAYAVPAMLYVLTPPRSRRQPSGEPARAATQPA